MAHVVDFKTLVIDNFKEAVKQVKWREKLAGTQYEDTDKYYLHQAQTYHGLLIQIGVTLAEIDGIEKSVVV